ncbi:MAG: leucyl aminopeptidase [Acidimicrobiia bacterium]
MSPAVDIARSVPRTVEAVGVPVATEGAVPRSLGMSRAALAANGFEGKPGQTLVLPSATGPTMVAVGIGSVKELSANGLRTAAAALARATSKRATVATTLADADHVDARSAAQAVVEGFALGGYRYVALKADKNSASKLERLTLVVPAAKTVAAAAGAERGQATADAVCLARDLANTPPGLLTATVMAERAVEVARSAGLSAEVIDEHQAREMRLGGLLGVNAGSAEPPRMVKLTYAPRNATGHVALVGKGVMYDSGGISLKPSDGMHVNMKMDMSGAAAVLGAMSALKALRVRTKVTGYLMCTDNMPSGSAMKLGDVLTIRNGKTVEIHNTDAEGRLVLADGLSLAVEEGPDAIVDIATLTGACVVALGTKIGGVIGNDQGWIEQVKGASDRVDEPVWQLPLAKDYRKLLDSNVADMKNVGGPYGGVITASLFLNEFVGEIPWAHLDIAGPMNADADEGWVSRGASAFGTRLMIDLCANFTSPKG